MANKKTALKTDEMTAYAVLSPLKHNGEIYAPIEDEIVTVFLTDDEADVLKELGIVSDLPAEPETISA